MFLSVTVFTINTRPLHVWQPFLNRCTWVLKKTDFNKTKKPRSLQCYPNQGSVYSKKKKERKRKEKKKKSHSKIRYYILFVCM